MQIKDKYKPIYQRRDECCCGPRPGLKDMILALDPGTPSAGELPEGGAIPVAQHAARREPRRDPRRARRRHARLPADPAERRRHRVRDGDRRHGAQTAAQDLRETFKRFEPTGRYGAQDHQAAARSAAHEHQARRSTTSSCSRRRSARRTTSSPRFVDSANANFQAFAAAGAPACARRCGCSRPRSRRRPRTLAQGRRAGRRARPDAPGAAAVRARARRRRCGRRAVPARDHADHPRPDPAVRARRRSRPSRDLRRATRKTSRRVTPDLTRAFKVAQHASSTRSPTTRPATRGLPVLERLGDHAGATLFDAGRARARSAAASCSSAATTSSCSSSS